MVAVYIDDEVEAWLKAQYPSSWLSVYAPEIEQQDLYDIKALPTLYLLDTNKYVLQKDARLDKILKYKFWASVGRNARAIFIPSEGGGVGLGKTKR